MIRLRNILLLHAILLSAGMSAQTAPDFMVTDSWGNTHRLYQDYLDQGKTVVVKVFFVACPPCNMIAPHLEPLYQSWGGGMADVQFIELSIQQSDNNTNINNYKNNHGTTYPAAGGQGGSVAATLPYRNGTFGIYTGTPTFVVIAPDKTVNYDVSGFNIQGTIDALDAAIAATGATGGTSSVAEVTSLSSIRMASNLVHEELMLQVMEDGTEFNLTLINSLGQPMMTQRFTGLKGDQVGVDISSLATGMWICRIEDSNRQQVSSYMFVKQ